MLKHKTFIPVNTPLMAGGESTRLKECIDTGWMSGEGPFVQEFETGFANYIGQQFGIAVANGSAALDVAVQSLGLQPDDEVLVPTFTIISPVFSIIRAGLKPVLVEMTNGDWNMDLTDLESRITSKTRAILVVHIYGMPVDMERVMQIADQHELKVIEDCAEVIGQFTMGGRCGSFGDLSVFSFYSNKNLTTGEGGMILTSNQHLNDKCRELRNLSFMPGKRRFIHEEMGWNYRLSNLQAAVGLAQLERTDEFAGLRKAQGLYYSDSLQRLERLGYELPLPASAHAENGYWVFGIQAPDEARADLLSQALNEAGVQTRPFFWCMHEQPVFQKMGLFSDQVFPVAEKAARCGHYLPGGLGLKRSAQDYVIEQVLRIAHA